MYIIFNGHNVIGLKEFSIWEVEIPDKEMTDKYYIVAFLGKQIFDSRNLDDYTSFEHFEGMPLVDRSADKNYYRLYTKEEALNIFEEWKNKREKELDDNITWGIKEIEARNKMIDCAKQKIIELQDLKLEI